MFGFCPADWPENYVGGQHGWILAKFFFCLFMDREEVEVHKLAKKKKNEANIQPLVNKGFIIWSIWFSGKFFLRDTSGSFEQARWLHLARSASQLHGAIWFILPAHGASHIITSSLTEQEVCMVESCRGLYTRPRSRFSHTDRYSSVNKMFIVWRKQ